MELLVAVVGFPGMSVCALAGIIVFVAMLSI
jgi:hypothetical protein